MSHAGRRVIGPTEGTRLKITLHNWFVKARKEGFVIVSEYIVVLLTGSSRSKCRVSVFAVFTLCFLSKLPSHTFEILDLELAKIKIIFNKLL